MVRGVWVHSEPRLALLEKSQTPPRTIDAAGLFCTSARLQLPQLTNQPPVPMRHPHSTAAIDAFEGKNGVSYLIRACLS